MRQSFETIIQRHRDAVEATFSGGQIDILESITREFLKAFKAGNKILFCGNGGSAADSQHIAAEFVARFKMERKSLPALALSTDTSILTAVSNDYDFHQVFARQVEGLGRKGDILVAISTSGKSRNVLEAVRQAKSQELYVVGMTGGSGGPLKDLADICFVAKAEETAHIQEMHITALHAVSEVVEEVLFGA